MMHGLILRTFQVFVQDTYGPEPWRRIVDGAGLDAPDFEAMLSYPQDTFTAVVGAAEVESWGGVVRLADFADGYSTTKTIEKMTGAPE